MTTHLRQSLANVGLPLRPHVEAEDLTTVNDKWDDRGDDEAGDWQRKSDVELPDAAPVLEQGQTVRGLTEERCDGVPSSPTSISDEKSRNNDADRSHGAAREKSPARSVWAAG